MDDLSEILGQEKLKDAIYSWLSSATLDSKKILILRGNSGTGKTHLIKEVVNKWENNLNSKHSIFANGDQSFSDRSLFPLINGIAKPINYVYTNEKIEKGITTLTRSLPYAGNFVSFVIELLSNLDKDKKKKGIAYLNQQEQDILISINSYYRDTPLTLVADNFQWWDQASISLLDLILSGNLDELLPFSRKIKVIAVISEDQVTESAENSFIELLSKYDHQTLWIQSITREQFLDVLKKFGGVWDLDDKRRDLLFSLTGGHLDLIKKIALLSNSSASIESIVTASDVLSEENGKQSFLERVLVTRLQTLGVESKQIIKLLEYAAIIGFNFSYDEIQCLTKQEKGQVQILIEQARAAAFINSDSKNSSFCHEIIREFFLNRLESKKKEYYCNFAECLQILRPSGYFERAGLLFDGGDIKNAIILYIIGVLKNIREGLAVPKKVESRILVFSPDYDLLNYYEVMVKGYTLFYRGFFQNAINQIEILEDIFCDSLVAEKYFLLSLCNSKSLNKDEITKAKNYLCDWDKLKASESEIWVRITLTLMSFYAHLDAYEQAALLERKVMLFLSQRITYDPDAEYGINLLRRKSSILHIAEIASKRTEECVTYFGQEVFPNVYRSPIQYYMALTNHSGNLILAGKFLLSFTIAQRALNVISMYPEITFPRIEMPLNNYILSGFLSKNLNVSESLKLYDSLFEKVSDLTSIILLKNNYIIFKALNGELKEALYLCNQLWTLLGNSTRKDNYFTYFVGVNRASLIYLTQGKSKALELLDSLFENIPPIPDKLFLSKRHSLIQSIFKSTNINDAITWNNYIIQNNPQELGPSWVYWGNGFLFSDIQFWSD